MKLHSLLFAIAVPIATSHAAVIFDFTGQGGTFDNMTSVSVPLVDGGINFSMTVTGTGGDLNSNASGIGINDANIDGMAESITLSFSIDTELNFLDLGGVGGDVSDGADVTIAGTNFQFFTGQPDFNGSSDVFTPATPIALTAGQTIVITGASATSVFDIDSISVTAVPEPSSTLLLTSLAGLFVLRRR